MYTYMYM